MHDFILIRQAVCSTLTIKIREISRFKLQITEILVYLCTLILVSGIHL